MMGWWVPRNEPFLNKFSEIPSPYNKMSLEILPQTFLNQRQFTRFEKP